MSLLLTDFDSLGESTVTLLSCYLRFVVFEGSFVNEQSGVLADFY